MNKLKKILFSFIILFSLIGSISAKEVTLYFFYGETCPHCKEEHKFLDEMEEKYSSLKVLRYEVWNNSSNSDLMKEKANELGISIEGVPLTIVDNDYLFGYNDVYSSKIEKMIKEKVGYEKDSSTIYNFPLIGKTNIKKVSIPIISIVLGLIDGFNPCAMWVLLFLITMLIGMKNKKRMWILGLTFLITSGVIYMLIMLSWLEIVVNLGFNTILRYIIAIIAIIGSIININSYINNKDGGCTVVDNKKRTKIFDKIKKFTHEKSFILAIFGVIGLAISVNLVELACSAGFPVIFTQILAINNISGIESFLYTLIYILFFLIDDIIVFIVAMVTLKVTGITTKYTKYSHLIGGILMLLIGIILMLKPEWLMFQF